MARQAVTQKKQGKGRERQQQRRRQRRQLKKEAVNSASQLRHFSNPIHYAASAGCMALEALRQAKEACGDALHSGGFPTWICHAAEATCTALGGKIAHCRLGDVSSLPGVSRVIRPNLESEIERLAREVYQKTGLSVGDIVQHKFISGLIGTIVEFRPGRIVRVKWENGEAEGQCSQIGDAGLELYQHVYFVTLHAMIDGRDSCRITCTNMAGEKIAMLNLHPHEDQVIDLLVQLPKVIPTQTRTPGMPMRVLQPLLPDGTSIGLLDKRKPIACALRPQLLAAQPVISDIWRPDSPCQEAE